MPSNPDPRPRKLTSEIDLSRLDVAIKTPEKPADREARLRREADDAAHERRKDFLLFVTSLLIIATSAFCCLVALLLIPTSSPWASPLLTLIVGGLLGYQTGKSQKPKAKD